MNRPNVKVIIEKVNETITKAMVRAECNKMNISYPPKAKALRQISDKLERQLGGG